MKKMLIVSLFALVSAPLFALPADKCCGKPRPGRAVETTDKCCGKPRPGRPAVRTTEDMTDKCGCNANKPKRATSTTKGCGSCCNGCNSCNNKPCCGR